jgi:toxin secretion/phage lysis holin
MNWVDYLKGALAIIGGILSWLFGGWLMFVGVVFALVVLDYITGMLAAKVNKSFSSKVGCAGIPKKVLILILVVTAGLLDFLIKTYINPTLAVCLGIVCTFYAVNESLSILENLGRAGVAYPDKLREVILVLNKKEQPPGLNSITTDTVPGFVPEPLLQGGYVPSPWNGAVPKNMSELPEDSSPKEG